MSFDEQQTLCLNGDIGAALDRFFLHFIPLGFVLRLVQNENRVPALPPTRRSFPQQRG